MADPTRQIRTRARRARRSRAIEEEILSKRREGRAVRDGLFRRPTPDIPADGERSTFRQGRQQHGGDGDDGVAAGPEDEQVGPVRHAGFGEGDAQPGAEAPEDEAVHKIHGEGVGEDPDPEFEG